MTAPLPPQLQNAISANLGAGGSYAASASGDPATQQAIANDYATGQGLASSAYGAGNSIQQSSNAALAFVAGWSTLANPNASLGDIAKATSLIVGTAEGVIVTASVTLGLITAGAVSFSVPVVGTIVGGILLAAAALYAAFVKIVPHASGGQIITTPVDQANALIREVYDTFSEPVLNGAPYTAASRTLAAQLAAYVQAELVASGQGTKTRCVAASATGFEYQCGSTNAITLTLASLLGSPARAGAILNILSILWDPRWRGVTGAASDPASYAIGTASEIDPNGGGVTDTLSAQGVLLPITSVPGMSAASYFCEILAAGALANIPNLAQTVLIALYLRLVQTLWLFEAAQMDMASPSVAPLVATIGFTAQEAVAAGAGVTNLLVSDMTKPMTATANAVNANVASASAVAALKSTLAYWVNGYNNGRFTS